MPHFAVNKGDAVWYSTADGACCLVGYEYPGARISTLQELLRGTVWLCLRSIKRMGLAPAFMAAMEKTDVAKEKHKKVKLLHNELHLVTNTHHAWFGACMARGVGARDGAWQHTSVHQHGL